MKKVLRIARLELSVLFYSPIAWLVLIVFMIQSSVTFIDLLLKFEANQKFSLSVNSLTLSIFGGSQGFFADIQSKLYLYLPLLTMGLLSRELHSGSIKLLLSSPVRNLEIILGKYLAMMIYGLLMLGILSVIVFAAGLSIENIDLRYIIGALFGLYLLICAYAAVGLFMSGLTSYQVVAAISTLAGLAALKFAGEIGRSVSFVRDITYWISMEGRVGNFINGLVSSKDIIYFLLVVVLFLILSVMKLNGGRVIQSNLIKALKYSSLIISVVFIGFISSLPQFTFYYDTTRFKTRTLTDESLEIIKQLNKPVVINSYPNILNIYSHVGAPKFRNFEKKQFEDFIRYLPGLKMNYFPYYDSTLNNSDKGKTLKDRAQRAATAYGYDFEKVLSDKEIRKFVDPRPEENRFFRMIEYDGKEVPLRMFNDMVAYPQEAEISAALKSLLIGPKTIGVVQGNDERSITKTGDKSYRNIMTEITSRSALINNGFKIEMIHSGDINPIPDSVSVLIIADPIEKYSGAFQNTIKDYLSRGGNLLLAAEPGKQDIVKEIASYIGIDFVKGQLLEDSKDYSLDLIQAMPGEGGRKLLNFQKPGIVSMPGSIGIDADTVTQFKVIDLLSTNAATSWNSSELFDTGKPGFKPDPGKSGKSLPVMLAFTRDINGKQQKIVVSGDADFMSNNEINRNNLKNINAEFTLKLFKWYSDNEFPIDAHRPEPTDVKIVVARKTIGWMKAGLQIVIPVTLLLLGALLIIRRRRN